MIRSYASCVGIPFVDRYASCVGIRGVGGMVVLVISVSCVGICVMGIYASCVVIRVIGSSVSCAVRVVADTRVVCIYVSCIGTRVVGIVVYGVLILMEDWDTDGYYLCIGCWIPGWAIFQHTIQKCSSPVSQYTTRIPAHETEIITTRITTHHHYTNT